MYSRCSASPPTGMSCDNVFEQNFPIPPETVIARSLARTPDSEWVPSGPGGGTNEPPLARPTLWAERAPKVTYSSGGA